MADYDKNSGEIWIYDVIGDPWWGFVSAQGVRDAMKEIGDQRITLRLNTPGGSVDEGVAIFNMLARHKPGVTTVVDSLAASMGSYLMMAGDERLIYDSSMVMIHNPWTATWGDEHQLRKTADVLGKYKQTLVRKMVAVTGKEADEVSDDLDAETWLSGQEIANYGLATGFADDDESPAEASVTRGLQSIAARSFSENRIPSEVFSRRPTKKKDTASEDRRAIAAAHLASIRAAVARASAK